MARIRTIKPDFFTSATMAKLPLEVRLTFIGLWTHCDDSGVAKWESRIIKGAVWPLDDAVTHEVVTTHLTLLKRAGLIGRYAVNGASFLVVSGWDEHQKISHPALSKFPPPPPELLRNPLEALAPEQGTGKRNREQGTGNREKGTGKRKRKIAPEEFESFWELVPKKKDRGAAIKAFGAALERTDLKTLLVGIARYAAEVKGNDPQYTKYPATWLNKDCWLDEPEPTPPEPKYFNPETDL